MRNLKVCFIILYLFSFSEIIAQTNAISGKVTDEKGEALTGAAIELRKASDTSLTKVQVTDMDGNFSFPGVPSSEYFLKISLMGFSPITTESFTYDGTSQKQFPPVKLSTSSVTLNEAKVTAIRPLIEVKSDMTVFNVENSINSTGSTAYELLQKAPGVVVDNNDNIMLKGRGGVLVQIDGKDSHMSQQDLADYLKSVQSTDVESIELISNPSSKYEAEGTAGIINIKMKKNKNYGTNGSVTAGYAIGTYSKYNTAISVNNRSKKLSLFSNYSNNWGDRVNDFNLHREQSPYKVDAASVFRRWGLNHNYKAGADYTLNSKHVVGVIASGNYSDINGDNRTRTIISNFNTEIPDSILQSDQTINGRRNNLAFNLNHRFADTTGTSLTTDLDYGYYYGTRDNFQPNIYLLPDYHTILSSSYYRSITPTTIRIYTAKSDYSQKFLKGKLGAGLKFSFVGTDNTFNFFAIDGIVETIDNKRSNHFTYDENVYAGYINYQKTFGKLDAQAGLRLEHTFSEGDLKSAADTVQDKNVKRDYTDLFPSAGITYNLNQNNTMALVYSKRIDRPDYHDLNPFEFIVDELSFQKGNPFLNPQYSDKIELSHTYKYATTVTLGYSHTSDFFSQITDTLSGGRSVLTPRNLAKEDILSLDISSSLQILKWYSIYFHLGVYNQAYDADFGNGRTINTDVTYCNLYAQNTFKLPANFTFEISGWYNSAGIWGGSYITEPQGSLDLGLQKKLFGEQATLKLSYTDIFYTAPWDSRNVYSGIAIRVHGNWESQQFRASLTWRFGNKQMKELRLRKTGSESEQNRIGGGE